MNSAFSFLISEPKNYILPRHRYFLESLIEAQKGMGTTHPNPSVGAVLVKNERVMAKGHTEPVGGKHAEKQVFWQVGDQTEGATLYVTLEPCSHFGRTSPCTDATINAKVKKVVYGIKDPNPLVNGRGLLALKEAGIEVSQIDDERLRETAEEIHRPFFNYILKKQPYTVLKIATSHDDKITSALGQKKARSPALSLMW